MSPLPEYRLLNIFDTYYYINRGHGDRAISSLASEQGLNTRPGHQIFASGNRAALCRCSAGFLGDLPFPPPLHSGAAPYSLQSPSSSLKTSLLRAAQISSLYLLICCVYDIDDITCNLTYFTNRVRGGGRAAVPIKPGISGAAVAERLAYSRLTKANRAQFPAGSLPDFLTTETCRTMPLVGRFSRGSPVSPTPSFQCRSIRVSITLIGSQDLAVKSRPNLFTHSPHPSVLYSVKMENSCLFIRIFCFRESDQSDVRPVRRPTKVEIESTFVGLSELRFRRRDLAPDWLMNENFSSVLVLFSRTVGTASRRKHCTARLARRSDEAPGVRVIVARIAPSLIDLNAQLHKPHYFVQAVFIASLTVINRCSEISRKDHKATPAGESSGTIPTCKYPGIEAASPWWEASVLTAQPPWPLPWRCYTPLYAEAYPRRLTSVAAGGREALPYGHYQLGSPLVDDRPIMIAVKYKVVSGVVWTNRKMVSLTQTPTEPTELQVTVRLTDFSHRPGICLAHLGELSSRDGVANLFEGYEEGRCLWLKCNGQRNHGLCSLVYKTVQSILSPNDDADSAGLCLFVVES
ncbi:hypothetical protein PR048_030749 [Dryococelus australis]|uniref:Uncharacterized protein n=1 Tax=Dryococelus australis TaxID=614101 RepID=A0ABQ9G9S8_9NEOP|nr:hypothetical protein PR048_030749 [Dryococelus australis]